MKRLALALLLAGCDEDANKPSAPPPRPAPVVSAAAAPSASAVIPQLAWELQNVKQLALAERLALAHDGKVTVHDVHSGLTLSSARVPGRVVRMFWDAEGKRLAVLSVEKARGTPTTRLAVYLRGWLEEVAQGSEILAAFTSDAIAYTSWGRVVIDTHVLDGEGKITALAVRSDGRDLALGRRHSGETFVEVWDVATRTNKRRIPCSGALVTSLAWSADWARLAWSEQRGREHHVAVMDREGKITRSTESIRGSAHEVAFSPDGKWLMTVSHGPTLWSVADASRHLDLRPGPDDAWGAAFVPDAVDRLALYGADSLRLVDTNTGRTITERDVPLGPKPNAFAFYRERLAAASDAKTVVVPFPTE